VADPGDPVTAASENQPHEVRIRPAPPEGRPHRVARAVPGYRAVPVGYNLAT